MIKIVTQTGDNERETFDLTEDLPPLRGLMRQRNSHQLLSFFFCKLHRIYALGKKKKNLRNKKTYYQNSKHHLSHVKGVSPVVIRDVPIVFLDAQQPTAKHLVIDVETFDEVQIEEHSETRGESFVIFHVYIVELEIVQLKMRGRRYSQTLSKRDIKKHKHSVPVRLKKKTTHCDC